ncbi:hypothetical protein Sjap_003138 [Stephania japonica]|uniref:Uncharacterized protein n=1 Tax=Stephania japonica TaxID=461633 RepID=A0AAP0KPQ7_9MAGN
MGEKWRRVDDDDDDDEVHLNIQEVWTRKMTQGRWCSRGGTTACGGAAFQSPPPETAGGAPLGSPTTMGCEEEGEKGWFPPPLLHYRLPDGWPKGGDPPTSRWDPCLRWREVRRAVAWRGVLPSTALTRGEHELPPSDRSTKQLTSQLISWTS